MKKGKKIIIILLALCLVAALSIGGVILLAGGEEPSATDPTLPSNVDTVWYDENGKEFVITTAEQLYGLAELSKTHDFKGQTIKLGGDIVLNEGDAAEWGKKAPAQLWNPITGFAGTFDGQGNTISGVYGNSIVTSLGLFTDTQKTCVIKNLKLVNSCFKNNNDLGTGSIIGVGGGKLENIYSDAVMISSGKYVGGLIGCVKAKGENQITNCWFDGTITMDGYDCSHVGGLVGAFVVEDAINTIQHSLSTADISCLGENVGGICGAVGNGAFLNLNDSMFTGTLEYDTNKYAVVGSMIGQVMNSGSLIVNDSYTVDEIANRTIGTCDGYRKGSAIAVGKDYLVGQGGYQWTTLDFENYWVIQKEGMPRLRYYAQTVESLEGIQKMVDISWYDQAGATFEISTLQQFYGFAYLSRSYDFRGQTIKLVADITINEGDASTWGQQAPAYNWTPIGWYGTSLSQRFKGTFDGQGHTISGIYAKGTDVISCLGLFGEVYHGAVVKNFKLVNSYFEGVQDSSVRGPVGSVAGRLRGTIENVYSNAVVVNSSKNTGGIVGMITGTGQNKISGCWFDGTLTGITRSGGILGGVYGNKGNIEATIEHCLNTGSIHVELGQAAVGGICGAAETWSILHIDDCLNAGTYQTYGQGKTESAHIGTILGTVTQTDGVGSKAVITDSYGVKDFYDRLIGWKFADEGADQTSVVFADREELIGYGGYQWTSLDFTDHWAVRKNDIPVPVAFAETRPSVAGYTRMVDYSWYDSNKSVFTVSTFQQLYAVSRLWDVANLFKDKTILLGADITINSGNAADWAKNAPAFEWEPIKFRGTFDGRGHTVSGVYVKGGAADNYIGFFHRIYKGATVKNLKLTNSYFEGTMAGTERGAVGSIAGRSNGMIDTVYSDAIVVNSARMTGGLVGMITGEGENKILNSWFDGQITGINRAGGILGGVYGNKENIRVAIQTCVNTGDITVKIGSGDVGGICGIAETGGTLSIKDCLNAGTFATAGEDKEPNTHIGSVFGSVTQKDGVGSTVVLNNVYGVKEFYSKPVGWSYGEEGISQTVTVQLSMDMLKETDGYRYTAFDFKKTWGLNGEGIPVPVAFATVKPDASAAEKLVDYSWYDAASDVYTITTREQLIAFGILCNGENDYFKGKTVKLGADITLNEGNAADWAATAPENAWTPVNFSGTFDGQGCTLSGLYVKSERQYTGFFGTLNSGASVKNLKLTNSYMEGNGTESRSGVGSVAGRNLGTIDTVYSNAILKNSKLMTGGIAGMSTGTTENKIVNCWFDGEMIAVGSTGGILGGTYAGTATVEHCLNTGKITVEAGTAIGGICGYAQSTGGVTVRDSLNAGTIVKGSGEVKQVGAIIGAVHANATETTAENAYGVTEFSEGMYGYGAAIHKDGSVSGARNLEDLKGYGASRWTTLDFEDGKHWVLKKDALPALSVFAEAELDPEDAKTLPDYRWYDETVDTYILTTAQQLYGFNGLCTENTDYFKGKTVKLGADIELGANTTDWAATPEDKIWAPVNFGGIFDGQGYTVSGLYIHSDRIYVGFFGTMNSGSVVKNLRITDSYIENTNTSGRCGTGSVTGRNLGTIDTVYSSAIVKNGALMTGGIVGMSTGNTENKIVNCWFDGEMIAGGSTGGILGGTYAGTATVEHCLNTGKITVEAGNSVGGICGYAQSTGGVIVRDSLNAGTFVKGSGEVKQLGAVIGAVHANATKTNTENAYGAKEFASVLCGYGNAARSASGTVKQENLADYGAYQWTTLDFAGGSWVLKKDAIPVPAVFDTTDLDLEYAKTLPYYTWYDENVDEYVITTARQLFAFNVLCTEDTDYFKGKTVKLGADIDLGANTTDWAATPEDKIWAPVNFGGTFDGQGHTVSGLYIKSDHIYVGFFGTMNSGSVVKNLRITDSYIENTNTSGRCGTGSVAGRNLGTIDTVYSSAIVKNGAVMTGGIAGMSTGTTENKIVNCWFNGEIHGGRATGGILGGAYAAKVNLEHCLNTGVMTIRDNSEYVGGLCGELQNASTGVIRDSLNAGSLTGTVLSSGTVIGRVDTKATLTAKDSYGVSGFLANAVGVQSGTLTDCTYAVRNLENIKGYGAYQWTTLDFAGGSWVLKKDAIPALNVFDDTDLDPEQAKTLLDYTWYTDSADQYVISTMLQMRAYAQLSETEGFVAKPVKLGAEEYVLTTAEELRAFAAVAVADGADYFAGKTVKLGADIDLGANTTDWETTPAENKWTPVSISGTFDGQGHTISGVYVKAGTTYVGFFHSINSGAVVRNLKLTGSYIENTKTSGRCGTGSIAGRVYGTIENVYSRAIVKNGAVMTGGIAGMSEGGTITNCWFDGRIFGGRATGGILGGTYAKAATIEHCLNTGAMTIRDDSEYVGGLCGELQNAATGVIRDSLNAGSLTGTVLSSGTIIGRVDTKATLTVEDTYGISGFQANAMGQKAGTVTGSNYAVRNLEDIKGYGAYQWTSLDFAGGTWVLKKDAIPALNVFDDTDLDLEQAKKLPDYSWYDENADVYVITTARQLFGFNDLCSENTDFFAGKTVKLGADIDLGANTADWAATPAENKWTPMSISGTFDGQGHTISGAYVKAGSTYVGFFHSINSGAVVRNLKLTGSYIENTNTSGRCGTGSIAGRVYGTIENVYSSAIVKNGALMTGGIAGMSVGGTITNCWFDGEIIAGGSTGGILGGTYNATATIEHCLNTGKITVEAGTAIGGLCGYAQSTGGVTISDSLNAGTIVMGNGTIKQVGTIVGAIHKNATLVVNDVYGISAFSEKAIGYYVDGTVSGSDYAVRNLEDLKGYGAYQWTSLDLESGRWVMKRDAIPLLGAFAVADLTVEDAKTLPDYSWYDENAEEYVISDLKQMRGYAEICDTEGFVKKPVKLGAEEFVLSTAEQLRAFAALCDDGADFTGKTVKLGESMGLGANTEDWAATAEGNLWTPVPFSGTFDGQGYTLSGVYAKGENAGLFSILGSGAVVRNLNLEKSFFEGTQTAGSVAGRNLGTIEKVYSTATVQSAQTAGGIAGVGGTVTNCRFAGTVTGATAGGILGGVDAAGAAVQHCLSTGTVTGTANAGGLIGSVQTGATAALSDSLAAGTQGTAAAAAGAIVGSVEGTLNIADTYGIQEFAANAIGAQSGTVSGSGYAVRNLADIKGNGAYQWTTLDFAGGSWVLKADAIPALGAFDTTDLDLAQAKVLPNYSWYGTAAGTHVLTNAQQLHGYVLLSKTEGFEEKSVTLGSDTYTITTAEQLRAFNTLCTADTNYFAGKTVKLGASIDLGANTADWAATPAENKWAPIAQFSGTFDGQGYTLSGVYVSTSVSHNGFFRQINSGATVMNLKLINSYIEGTKTGSKQRYATGSIAGLNNGTIRSVYSCAIVSNTTGNKMTGGIAGMVNSGETGSIINCWFDGTVYGGEATAGILGGAYKATVNIEHCLNTGTLIVSNSAYYAGGLCGDLQNVCTTVIKDSLNAGSLTGNVKQSGTIVGRVDNAKSTLELKDTYGVSEFQAGAIGKETGKVSGSDYAVKALEEMKGTGAETLSFRTEDAIEYWWIARDGKLPVLVSFEAWAEGLGK